MAEPTTQPPVRHSDPRYPLLYPVETEFVNVAVVVTPVDTVITSEMPTEAVKLNPTAKELVSRNGIVQVFHMI
jgi:hypothetical protein